MTLPRLMAAFAWLALAFGLLIGLVAVLFEGPASNSLAGTMLVLLFGNLAAASVIAALYVLDNPDEQWRMGIRRLTRAGWALVAVTGNVMAAALIWTPTEIMPMIFAPWITAIVLGLPLFLMGWLVLTYFGFRIWRNECS